MKNTHLISKNNILIYNLVKNKHYYYYNLKGKLQDPNTKQPAYKAKDRLNHQIFIYFHYQNGEPHNENYCPTFYEKHIKNNYKYLSKPVYALNGSPITKIGYLITLNTELYSINI